jgi:hypothetical protein
MTCSWVVPKPVIIWRSWPTAACADPKCRIANDSVTTTGSGDTIPSAAVHDVPAKSPVPSVSKKRWLTG